MMVVDMMRRGRCYENDNGVEDAAYAGVQAMHKLIDMLSNSRQVNEEDYKVMDTQCRAVADAAFTKFENLISLLGRPRTGHARFRRAPAVSSPAEDTEEEKAGSAVEDEDKESATEVILDSSGSRVYCPRPLQQLPPLPPRHQTTSAASLKRKYCRCDDRNSSTCEGRCHCCSKRRKLKMRRTVRVPAVSMKMAEIPPDDFSWRKYGQKPIKGSLHPRGYYKCSAVRGCPARKHVERAMDDPSMMIVTYEGDHNHILGGSDEDRQRILVIDAS